MSRVTLEASSTVASALLVSLVMGAARAQEALPTIDVAAQPVDIDASRKERRPIVGPLGPAPAEAKSLTQITQTISVVDRQQIELTNPTGLLEILAQAPGVAIARAGGIGGQIYLRGFSSNTMRSPLYVDGDRLHGRNTLQLNYFAPEEIEQVEVIRGPASVLYGSDALTGLVNVVTRQPSSNVDGPFRFRRGGASFGYASAATALSTYEWAEGAGDGFSVRGGLAGRKGLSYETPLGVARNGDYRSIGGDFSLGYSPTPDQRFSASFRGYVETDGRAGGVGGAPGYPYLNVRQSPNELLMGRLAYSGDFTGGLISHVEASAYVNYFDTHLATINTTSAKQTVFSDSHVIGPVVIGGRVLAVAPWSIDGFGSVVTKFGGDAFYERRPGSLGTSITATLSNGVVTALRYSPLTQSVPESFQTNGGIFMLHEWTPFEALTVSAGGRFDYFNTRTRLSPLASAALLSAYVANSDTDRLAPTGSIGAVLRVAPALDVVGNISTAFRHPTNAELFNSTATSLPNPNLQPETGVTYEGGLRLHVAEATASITGFHSVYHNLLQTQSVTYMGVSTYTQSQNVGRAEIDGVEFEGRWQATPELNLFGNFTMLEGTNTTTGRPLPSIAPFRARFGVQVAPPGAGYSLQAVLNAAAGKTRIDTTQEYKTSGYVVLNLYSSFDLGVLISPKLGDTRLSIGLENVFNTAYVDAATFANVSYGRSVTNPLLEPGRNFIVKLTHNF
ncbi:TonB-dependent receptor [Methylosinus sp. LW3]|uniref:TonB-dependent receptor n=1 Tax=Methylosinus sp. LW3 TaxID=107635 RepID=UPI000466ABBF|nr:TonB-dependent receptor [Methylosinus sp. LW3]